MTSHQLSFLLLDRWLFPIRSNCSVQVRNSNLHSRFSYIAPLHRTYAATFLKHLSSENQTLHFSIFLTFRRVPRYRNTRRRWLFLYFHTNTSASSQSRDVNHRGRTMSHADEWPSGNRFHGPSVRLGVGAPVCVSRREGTSRSNSVSTPGLLFL